MPKVSVVIPLFNKVKFITRAIDSVFSQTYQDFEIVVVDDGSTDGGPELVRRYQDSRLRMVVQQNEGPGSARNRGIKESSAPYLAFLDADDEWLPNFLHRYLDVLRTHPDCDYVVGPYFEGDLKANKGEEWRQFGIKEGPWRLPANVSHSELHNYLTILHSTCTILCKRHVIEKYGGFYSKTKCTYGEDRYLELQLMLNHLLYRITEPLAWYHTEVLGISSIGAGPRPVMPLMTDPEPVRLNCPQPFLEVLERYLASHALTYALEYASISDLSTASSLMRRFPMMRNSKRRYAHLLIRIFIAKVTGLVGIPRLRVDARKRSVF